MSSPELVSDFVARGRVAGVAEAPRPGMTRILLWDLPLRVFHWALVVSVSAAVVTGELGGAWMKWHGRAGLTIVGLLVFRVAWGFVGSATSRFGHFAPSPGAVVRYLRGHWRGVGHNPLGALSVFALLGLLALQATTGLFGKDDIAFAGPLNPFVDDALGSRLTGWHRLLAWGLFALMALHMLAIAVHVAIRRHRLVRPMLTGVHHVAADVVLPPARRPRRHALVASVALAAAVVVAIAEVGRAPAAGAIVHSAAPASAPAPSW